MEDLGDVKELDQKKHGLDGLIKANKAKISQLNVSYALSLFFSGKLIDAIE
jgi:hypothetical protein